MVSLGKLTAGHEEYYEREVAGGAEDYYAMRGEAAGEWIGSGAQALGLEGAATGGQLRALLEGRDPATGEMLRSRAVQVTGWDVTYSPPKSVSVLHAAGDPRIAAETLAAHRTAVRVGAGLSGVRRVLDAARRGWDDAAGGGGVRRRRVRPSGQPRRGCAAAFPCGHRQHDARRWALDHAGRSGAVRASEDRVGAVSRRAAGRADAAAGGRVGAGGAGQAGGRDQRRAAGGVARSEPSSPGDRATDGGARGVQPAGRPGRRAGYAQGQGLRRRSARRRARAAHADRRRRDWARPSSPTSSTVGGWSDPTKGELVRLSRELLGPAGHDRASVHVLAPRRHPAVGQRSTARANRPTESCGSPTGGWPSARSSPLEPDSGDPRRPRRPAAADAARPPRRAAVLDPDAAGDRAGPARDRGQAPPSRAWPSSRARPSSGRSPRTRR